MKYSEFKELCALFDIARIDINTDFVLYKQAGKEYQAIGNVYMPTTCRRVANQSREMEAS